MKYLLNLDGAAVTARQSVTVLKPNNDDIIDLQEIDVISKTGDGEHDFVLEHQVIVTGKRNVDDLIQSFADVVNINDLIKKVALTGDRSLLQQITPQYGVVPSVPDNTAEQKAIIEAGKAEAKKAGIDMTQEALDLAIQKAVSEALAKHNESEVK